MTRRDKDLNRILDGRFDRSIDFDLLLRVLIRLGFQLRVQGSHHTLTKPGVPTVLVIQPRGGWQNRIGFARPGMLSSSSRTSNRLKYEIVIYWSDEDGCYIAAVPDLPGCMADGETYEQALAMAQEVIPIWLKAWAELGREAPRPRQRALSAPAL